MVNKVSPSSADRTFENRSSAHDEHGTVNPTHPALVFLASPDDHHPQVVTRGELLVSVRAAAGGLIACGVRAEDAVAILAPSTPEALIAFLAAASVARAFPVNPLLSPDVIARQFEIAGVTACFSFAPHPDSDAGARAQAAVATCGSVDTMIELPSGAEASVGSDHKAQTLTWDELQDTAALHVCVPSNPERTAALFHTGGTTGNPKLAELNVRALAAGPRMAAAAINWQPGDRVLNLLPYFHVGGCLTITLSALSAGATIIGCGVLGARNTDLIDQLWTVIADHAVSVPVMVPTSWAAVAAKPLPRKPSSVRGLVTGASAMPAALARTLEKEVGVPMCQVFGMTELAGICTAQPLDGVFRSPAVGYPPTELEVALPDSGGSGAPLSLRGPNLFSGYRTADGRSDAPEDWFSTGDLAQKMDDGQIVLLGRTKDVIIRSGHNIDPEMIEEAAYRVPGVIAAAAVGMPDDYAGEIPVLYVQRSSRKPPADELCELVGQHVAEPPARPRLVIDVEEMPLTPVGKIARYKLRQRSAVAKAAELLTAFPPCTIECDDAGARDLVIRWSAPLPLDQTLLADDIVATVGLRASHVGPDGDAIA